MEFPGIKKVSSSNRKNSKTKSFRDKVRDTAKVTMSIPFRDLLSSADVNSDDKPEKLDLPEDKGSKDYFVIAREQLELNRSKCAEKAARRGMETDDVDGHEACILWTDIGNGMYDANQKKGAVDAFRSAYMLNDKVLTTVFNLGVAHQVSGNLDEAEKLYKKALLIDTYSGETWGNMGVVHFYRDELDKAEESTRKAIKINAKSVFAWDNLACLLAMKGNLVEALDACFDAIDIVSDFKQSWFKIGMIYFEQKNYDLAENAFNKSVGLEGLEAMIHYHLGIIALTRDDIMSAFDSFEQAMKADKMCEMGPEAWTMLKLKALQLDDVEMAKKAEINSSNLEEKLGPGRAKKEEENLVIAG